MAMGYNVIGDVARFLYHSNTVVYMLMVLIVVAFVLVGVEIRKKTKLLAQREPERERRTGMFEKLIFAVNEKFICPVRQGRIRGAIFCIIILTIVASAANILLVYHPKIFIGCAALVMLALIIRYSIRAKGGKSNKSHNILSFIIKAIMLVLIAGRISGMVRQDENEYKKIPTGKRIIGVIATVAVLAILFIMIYPSKWSWFILLTIAGLCAMLDYLGKRLFRII